MRECVERFVSRKRGRVGCGGLFSFDYSSYYLPIRRTKHNEVMFGQSFKNFCPKYLADLIIAGSQYE